MDKFSLASGTAGSGIYGLIDAIDRLGHAYRERVIRVVVLLARAPKPVQQVAQSMLGRFLDNPPTSAAECLAEINAVISYLETGVDDDETATESRWDDPRTAGGVPRTDRHRYN